MEKAFEIFKYPNEIELIAQNEPIRLLYVRQRGEFITHRFVTLNDFSNDKDAFFLESVYDGKGTFYYNYSDAQLDMLKERLEKIKDLPKHVPDLFEIIEKIEEDFSDRRGFRQEWESYSNNDQEMLKMSWHAEILSSTDLTNVKEVSKKIPQIIKNSWLSYSGLRSAFEETDEDILDEIMLSWGNIIKEKYKEHASD